MVATNAQRMPYFLKLLAHDLRWRILRALAQSDYRVQELIKVLKQPPNLVSYHLKRLRDAKLVRERRSSADGRDIYYSLDLDKLRNLYLASGNALHPVLTEPAPDEASHTVTGKPVRVLFLCTHNSARSQMAEGLARTLGKGEIEAFSAGTEPSRVHPDAIRAMAELGIDIRQQHSKSMTEYLGQHFDYVITVCDRARESCPLFPGDPVRIHWSFPDPAEIENPTARARAFKQTASELMTRISNLLLIIERDAQK